VVVIEDIDSAGIDREQGPGAATRQTPADTMNGFLGIPQGMDLPPGATPSRNSGRYVTLAYKMHLIWSLLGSEVETPGTEPSVDKLC
jgi:hypothetical protein